MIENETVSTALEQLYDLAVEFHSWLTTMISIGIGTGSFFLNRRLISFPINNRTMHVNPTINAAILVVVISESTAAMLCNTTEVS